MDQQSLIYNFLLAPRYRVWRYLLVTLFLVIVALNQALSGYQDIMPLMGNNVYWIVAGIIVTYIVILSISVRLFVPMLLYKGRYMGFIVCIVINAFIFTFVANIAFFYYDDNFDFFSKSIIIDNLSAFVIYILCISGVIIPVFLKNWMESGQHLGQLKLKQESSRIEQMKEQINPSSFFKTLGRSRSLVKTDPDKASVMLIKLGQLLRYQLYDCNRNEVLLSAEISFLRNYLDLEKLHSSLFDYTITTTGNMNGIFLPPSILLPYVQSVVNVSDGSENGNVIRIEVANTGEAIVITIDAPNLRDVVVLQDELLKVKERLNTIYKNSYGLTVTYNEPDRTTIVNLELNTSKA